MNESQDNTTEKILISLKKAHAHIGKIIHMVEDDAYCIDVIQQLNAVSGYIDSARNAKIKNHLNSCFSAGISTNDPQKKEALIEELLRALRMS